QQFSNIAVQYRLSGEVQWQESAPLHYFNSSQLTSPDIQEYESPVLLDSEFELVWNPPNNIVRNTMYIVRLRSVDSDNQEHFSNVFRARFNESITFAGLRRNAPSSDRALLIDPLLDTSPSADDYVLWGRVFTEEPISTVRVFVRSDNDPRYA